MKALKPDTVVLVGSSSIVEEIGMTAPEFFRGIEANLTQFKGSVRVVDIDEPVEPVGEMAVIALPPAESLVWAEKCAAAGAEAIVQLTGGFTADEREAYRELIDRFGFRLVGPNSIMGYLDTAIGLNTAFNDGIEPTPGPVSFIVQSGGVGAAVLDTAISEGVGISRFAFVGDKVDIDDEVLLREYAEDRSTRAIGLYVEGVKDGRSFVDTAAEVSQDTPIVALKGGISKEGARRAQSHTASVSGSDDIFDIALKEAGVIRVPSIQSLIHTTFALALQPALDGKRIAVVSNVGGPSILAADAVVREGLKMARLDGATVEAVHARYPGVELINPVDLIADAGGERYSFVLDAVLADDNVDGVIVVNQMKSCFFRPEDVDGILESLAKTDKPVVDVVPGGTDFRALRHRFIEAGIPVYSDPSHAVEAMEALHRYSLVKRGEYA